MSTKYKISASKNKPSTSPPPPPPPEQSLSPSPRKSLPLNADKLDISKANMFQSRETTNQSYKELVELVGNGHNKTSKETCICWDPYISHDHTKANWSYTRKAWKDVTHLHTKFKRIWLLCDLCLTHEETEEKKQMGSNIRDARFDHDTVDGPYLPMWLLYFTKDNFIDQSCEHIRKFLIQNFKSKYLEKMVFCHDEQIKENYEKFIAMEERAMTIPNSVPTHHLNREFYYCTAKHHMYPYT